MKWLLSTLVGILLVISGYTYRATDDRTYANQAAIIKLRQDLSNVDADLQQEKVRTDVFHKHIEEQLADIKQLLGKIEDQLQRRRY